MHAENIANRPVTLAAHVERHCDNGVNVAQGGREHGFAVHLMDSRLAFDVRVDGKVARIVLTDAVPACFAFTAWLKPKRFVLQVNGETVDSGKTPTPIQRQARDGFDVGRDNLTAAGDYQAPNPLDGKITQVSAITGEEVKSARSTGPFKSERITQ